MNNLVKGLVLSIGLLSATPTIASTPTNLLATCLVDTLNGKERKKLAKWIFFSIGSHPEISSYMNANDKDILESDKLIGGLLTRILTEDCPNELKTAYKTNPLAIQQAFELVGQVAMQELMTNKETIKAITNYSNHADLDKINSLLVE